MAVKEYSMGDAVRFGWDTLKGNIGFFIGFTVIMILITYAPTIVSILLGEGDDAAVGSILSFIFIPVQIIAALGATKIAAKFTLGEKPELADLFRSYRLFFRYLGSSILVGIIALIGLILLIIPGIILIIRLQFFVYLIVDKNAGAIEAIQQSWEMTKGKTGNLFLFGLLLFAIEVAGLIALGVGLLVAAPVAFLAQAYVYRKLADHSPSISPSGSSLEPALS